jgi:GNAT superfamily N-acetyltransferase
MESCLEQHRGEYCVSADPDRLDLSVVHEYLSKSYWSAGIPIEVVKRAMEGSICFGLFHRDSQIGFARVITDGATFAYLCDVYVLDDYQRQGLGHWLMEVVTGHPHLQGLRRFVLVTRDAHRLYERFGFLPLARPEGYMELHRPNVYSN